MPRESFDIAPNVLTLALSHAVDELVVHDRGTLEDADARRDKLGRTLVVEHHDEPLPEEGEWHLASEWLRRDERVYQDVARDDPLHPAPSNVSETDNSSVKN